MFDNSWLQELEPGDRLFLLFRNGGDLPFLVVLRHTGDAMIVESHGRPTHDECKSYTVLEN